MVRSLVSGQYQHRWGNEQYAKEMFLLGAGTNIRRHGLTHKDFTPSGSMGRTAWDYMPGSNVYQSILSYNDKFPAVQAELVKAVGSKMIWAQAVVRGSVFKALKYRSDLLKSFTFAVDIDDHRDSPDLAAVSRQAYDFGVYVRDEFHLEMMINKSGGGMHLRIPDHMMAQVIDMPTLFNDNVNVKAGGYSWIDMRRINAALVHMTEGLVKDVFGDRANGVDIHLHSNSDRVFRTLYSIHPSTGTITLPLRLDKMESVSHEDCHISQVRYDRNTIQNDIMVKYTRNQYMIDWTDTHSTVPRLQLCKVKNLLNLLYRYMPIDFHKYLLGHRLDD